MKTYCLALSLACAFCLATSHAPQAEAEPNGLGALSTTDQSQRDSLNQSRRWIADIKRIDTQIMAQGVAKDWSVVDFLPTFPGSQVIEEKSVFDKEKNQLVPIPGSESSPLFRGRFVVHGLVSANGEAVVADYRVRARSFIYMGPVLLQAYEKADPLRIGGYALVHFNPVTDPLDPKHFGPVLTLPEEWAAYVIQNQFTNTEATPKLDSPNPFQDLAASRRLLQEDPSPAGKNVQSVTAALVKSHDLLKATLLSLLVGAERPRQNDQETEANAADNRKLASQIVDSAITPNDMEFLLLGLENAGVTSTYLPETGNAAPGLGAAVLRSLAAKIQAMPERRDWLELKSLLNSFNLLPSVPG